MNWHAAVVHLPIALALVWPVLDVLGFFLKSKTISWVAVGLLVTSILGSVVATATGQIEYDQAVVAGVSSALLDQHASIAGVIPWAMMGVCALRLWLPGRVGRSGQLVSAILGVLIVGLVVRVGHSGGDLVYTHGVGVSSSQSSGEE